MFGGSGAQQASAMNGFDPAWAPDFDPAEDEIDLKRELTELRVREAALGPRAAQGPASSSTGAQQASAMNGFDPA